MAVVEGKKESSPPTKFPLPAHKDSLPRDEGVIKDAQGMTRTKFRHGGFQPFPGTGSSADDHLPYSRRISRGGKGYRPVRFFLGQQAGRGDQDLIGIGGNAVVGFSPADDNTVLAPFDDAQIKVGVQLRTVRSLRSRSPQILVDVN